MLKKFRQKIYNVSQFNFRRLIKALRDFFCAYFLVFLWIFCYLITCIYIDYKYKESRHFIKKDNIDTTFRVNSLPRISKKEAEYKLSFIGKDLNSGNRFFLEIKLEEDDLILFKRKLRLGQVFQAKIKPLYFNDVSREEIEVKKAKQNGYLLRANIKNIKFLSYEPSLFDLLKEFGQGIFKFFYYNLEIRGGTEIASLISGITIGNEVNLAPETKEIFRVLGLSHILVASGSNLSIVITMLAYRRRLRKRSYMPSYYLFVLFFYVLLSDFDPSLVRSLMVCYTEFFVGKLGREQHPAWYNSLAGIFSIIIFPHYVFNMGYLMSMCLGLILAFVSIPPLEGLDIYIESEEKNLFKRIKIYFIENLRFYIAAQFILFPFLIMFNSRISIFAVLAQFAILPLLKFIPYLALVCMILLFIPILSFICLAIIDILTLNVYLILKIINQSFILNSMTFFYQDLLFLFFIIFILAFFEIFWGRNFIGNSSFFKNSLCLLILVGFIYLNFSPLGKENRNITKFTITSLKNNLMISSLDNSYKYMLFLNPENYQYELKRSLDEKKISLLNRLYLVGKLEEKKISKNQLIDRFVEKYYLKRRECKDDLGVKDDFSLLAFGNNYKIIKQIKRKDDKLIISLFQKKINGSKGKNKFFVVEWLGIDKDKNVGWQKKILNGHRQELSCKYNDNLSIYDCE